ncbi:hypothetical protein EX30DRAFT_123740 [Ascodesmis nigricans]|uniref:Uncharacterized protein n=1 Tax=Ascodesmis nigricans TaxID=341454 RepID=A0A4S2MP57_9PEZI|nr:hypothetical protein EX30DRAFT_123740 [Ascodesmis nigricans]
MILHHHLPMACHALQSKLPSIIILIGPVLMSTSLALVVCLTPIGFFQAGTVRHKPPYPRPRSSFAKKLRG